MSDEPMDAAVRCPFLAQLQDMPRLTETRYADGLGALYEGADPAAVAQHIFDQDGNMPNSAGLSTLFTTWGQFLDHDLSLTPEGEHEFMDDGLGHDIGRSEVAPGSGIDGPRIQQNAITWQIDGNNIYGASDVRLEDVRSFDGGKLTVTEDHTSDRGLLPYADEEKIMAGELGAEDPVYLAGDIRANENPNLLSMHTLWVREHNYWADRLAEEHPDWDDQQLFDGARQIVEFELQKITYEEWLPHLIGNVMPDPEQIAHDPDANGEIAIEFSTAAFRFGHTLVSSMLTRVNEDGTEAEGGHLTLMDAFFNHHPVKFQGIDSLIRGQTSQSAQELDTKVIDDLNFFLATPDGVSGFSLVALNLLRGADHGLQSYIDTRAALLGDIDPTMLDPQDFSIITTDPALQEELASVYEDIFQVDLWVGGLAEDKMEGAQSGPLFTYIISEQFLRSASADETFYQLDEALGAEILAEVMASGMQDVILRNTDIDLVPEDPFLVTERVLTEMDGTLRGTMGDDSLDLQALDISGAVRTGQGDDTVVLSGGSKLSGALVTGKGSDVILQSSGTIAGAIRADAAHAAGDDLVSLSKTAVVEGDIFTGGGDDTVIVQDVAEVGDDILTGHGDDVVVIANKARVGDDIYTGYGDDAVSLGARTQVDKVNLGDGSDTLIVQSGAGLRHVDGGEQARAKADDNAQIDTLRIEGRYRVEWQDGDPDSEAGTLFYLDAEGADTGESFTFEGFEVVMCFTPGTLILTGVGKRAVDSLEVGDLVMTLDRGLQPIRWIGRRCVPAFGKMAPVEIAKGALGNTRALKVSPQHRMLLASPLAELLFGRSDVLAPAKALINDQTIRSQSGGMVEYIHLLFDSHEIVLAEGIPTESFHPGAVSLDAMSVATRAELFAVFPELALDPTTYGPAARMSLRGREVRLLSVVSDPKI